MESRSRRPGQRWMWPLGPWPTVLFVGACIATILNGTFGMLSWSYLSWPAMNSQFMRQTMIVAPLAGAFATYYSGRISPPTRVFAIRSFVRPVGQIVWRDLGLLLACALGAYVVGIAPAMLATALSVEVGSLDPLALLTGVGFVVASVVFGYVVGLVGRTSLWAPLTFVLLLAVAVMGPSYTYPLSPVPPEILDAGSELARPLLIYRLCLFVLIVVTGVFFALELRSRERRIPGGFVALFLGASVVGSLVPLTNEPAVFEYEADPPTVCRTVDKVEYCVHEARRDQLDEMVAGGSRVVRSYGFAPQRIRRVYDDGIRGKFSTDDRGIAWTGLQPTRPVDEATAADITTTLVDEACGREVSDGGGEVSDAELARMQAISDLFEWLQNPDRKGLDGKLIYPGTSDAEVQSWIKKHDKALATCSVPTDQFLS